MQLGELLAIHPKGDAAIAEFRANLDVLRPRHGRPRIGVDHARKQENQREAEGDILASKPHMFNISDHANTWKRQKETACGFSYRLVQHIGKRIGRAI